MVYSAFWGSHYATVGFKYLMQAVRTLGILVRNRPGVVFVMAPPPVACLPVWLYAKATGAKFVIDAHTGAFFDGPWNRLGFLQRFFSRRAVTTVVTNRHLGERVESWGADATIVTDVPVCFPEPDPVALHGDCTMTLVASFCPDEPIETFFEAAARTPEVQFYVTGDDGRLAPAIRAKVPTNVRFTGFLPDSRYVGQLQASDAVIALTTRDHTMQRAAYEAVYLGKPVLTSDFAVLRETFPKGAVHVDATRVDDVVRGIAQVRESLAQLRSEAEQLRSDKLERWDTVASHFAEMLEMEPPVPVAEGASCGVDS